LSLKSEVAEGFLRSGTAESAVPPVEMTISSCAVLRENPTSAELLEVAATDLIEA